MVSTHSQQYIKEFAPTTEGKSPLALLAKTCETIGMPDTPLVKRDKKESSSPESKKSEPVTEKKKERTPESSPSTSKAPEPITATFPGLPKTSMPTAMGFPFAPFYPSMLPYMPQFPSFMPFMQRTPCPAALMRQPCVTPGCTFCHDPTAAAAMAFNPLFAAYASMMPTTSAPSMPSFMMNTTAASTPTKLTCSWMESNGTVCSKQFTTAEEFTAHMKTHTLPSATSASTTSTPVAATPEKRPRFHPYTKPMTPVTPAQLPLPFNPMALQAMYNAQRMMMPHP